MRVTRKTLELIKSISYSSKTIAGRRIGLTKNYDFRRISRRRRGLYNNTNSAVLEFSYETFVCASGKIEGESDARIIRFTREKNARSERLKVTGK